jgi:hypothetical protein
VYTAYIYRSFIFIEMLQETLKVGTGRPAVTFKCFEGRERYVNTHTHTHTHTHTLGTPIFWSPNGLSRPVMGWLYLHLYAYVRKCVVLLLHRKSVLQIFCTEFIYSICTNVKSWKHDISMWSTVPLLLSISRHWSIHLIHVFILSSSYLSFQPSTYGSARI